jgi:uncharacterized protein (TIGR03435 family)
MRLLKVTIYLAAFFLVHACESRVFQSHTLAQTRSATDGPEFEVASVKPNTSMGDGPRGISLSPSGRFAWNWMTVRQLILSAYAELDFKQIAGGPSWIDTARFDIAATSPDALKEINPDGTPRGLFRRLRTLLEDRFALKTHIESREIPVYALQPNAAPIAMGAGLRTTDIDCEAIIRDSAAGRKPQVPYGRTPPCALAVRPGQLNGHAITMAQVITALSGPAGRPIVDRTGLKGSFDVELKWAAELPLGAQLNGAPAPLSDGPSLFTALREQLGLKLDATRASVPVLVIDSAQLPSPD